MASSTDYLEFVLDLLRDVPAVTNRKMMGEYLLYSDGVLFGGIYDDRLLLKDTPAARAAFHAPRRQRGPGLYRRSGSRHARGVAEAEEEALASRDRAVNGARPDLTAQAFLSVLTSKK